MTSTSKTESHSPAGWFVTTRWSVVLRAAECNDTPRAKAALETLCQTYWQPLYLYARRRGYSPEDAQDLTQGFIFHLIERNRIASVSAEKGRFRSFLLASMNHFLSDEYDKSRAQKRGAGNVVTVDWQTMETRFGGEPASSMSPEKLFDQRWAIALLETVYERLEKDYDQQGKSSLFAALRTTLTGRGASLPYAQLAGQLGMSESALKVRVHRLRQRYRDLLRQAIADTVSSPEQVEDELAYLIQTLGGR